MNWTIQPPLLRVLLPCPDMRRSDVLTFRRSSVSPLFATHTRCPQIVENPPTLSLVFATHTDFAPVSPASATHTKTAGVYTNSSRFGTEHPRSMRVLSEPAAADESKDLARRLSLTAIPPSRDEKPATVTPLAATLMNRPASVDSKEFMQTLNPLDATLTKNTGGGGCYC